MEIISSTNLLQNFSKKKEKTIPSKSSRPAIVTHVSCTCGAAIWLCLSAAHLPPELDLFSKASARDHADRRMFMRDAIAAICPPDFWGFWPELQGWLALMKRELD